jgi:hypothetical protein
MAASTEVRIGGEQREYVWICPLSRRHPGQCDYWDGNWITCEIGVAAGGFRGGFRADLRSEEFVPFLEGLQRLSGALQGAAHFTTMEGQLALVFTGDAKGRIQVSGKASDDAGTGNCLEFVFDIDQTYLPSICRSLQNLLVAFPVVGTTTG